MTILGLLLVAWFLPPIIQWLFINAAWTGTDRTACLTIAQGGTQPEGWSGACWAFVNAKYEQFIYGRYPISERWRVNLTALMFVVLLVPLLIPRAPHKVLNAILFFFVFRLSPSSCWSAAGLACHSWKHRFGAACW